MSAATTNCIPLLNRLSSCKNKKGTFSEASLVKMQVLNVSKSKCYRLCKESVAVKYS